MPSWITVAEAARRLGYCRAYFVRTWCEEGAEKLTLDVRRGPKGRRRIQGVSEDDVAAAQREWIKKPA